MYLMIENKGVADARSFTKLGLSTARGKSDRIGQFGTGAKHGILCLIRHGLFPTLYCGKTKMEFVCQPNLMGKTEYNDVSVRIDGKAPMELSFTLEFGALDWTDVNMGLRELVSNAIDNADSIANVTIKFVDNMRAKDGYTRIFVPSSPAVQHFASEIHKRFLHFSNPQAMSCSILEKKEAGKSNIYRKGVFVRQMESYYQDSLFDYNFGEEFKIDECRNADAWSCGVSAARLVSDDMNAITTIFRHFVDNSDKVWEDEFSDYYLDAKPWWLDLWKSVAGENAVTMSAESILGKTLTAKGFKPIIVPKSWRQAMRKVGIPEGADCVGKIESSGNTIVEVPQNMLDKFNQVWSWFIDCNMTNGKNKPKLAAFAKTIEQESGVLFGYYENGTVFINVDYADNTATHIEELAHYVTGAADNTREFQEFAFQFATRLAEIIYT